LNLGLLAL